MNRVAASTLEIGHERAVPFPEVASPCYFHPQPTVNVKSQEATLSYWLESENYDGTAETSGSRHLVRATLRFVGVRGLLLAAGCRTVEEHRFWGKGIEKGAGAFRIENSSWAQTIEDEPVIHYLFLLPQHWIEICAAGISTELLSV